MARQARVKSDYGTFHIQQTSASGYQLFRTDEDRAYLLKVVQQAKEVLHFDLISYCMISDCEYHLVVELKGSDLSQMMKSINIGYSLYRKDAKGLYKDRYKSTLLPNEEALRSLLDSLHCQAKSHSDWNQYCQLVTPSEPCENCIKSVEEARAFLMKLSAVASEGIEQVLKDKETRNNLIRAVRKQSTLSLKEIGVLFGGLSESAICKILKDCH